MRTTFGHGTFEIGDGEIRVSQQLAKLTVGVIKALSTQLRPDAAVEHNVSNERQPEGRFGWRCCRRGSWY